MGQVSDTLAAAVARLTEALADVPKPFGPLLTSCPEYIKAAHPDTIRTLLAGLAEAQRERDSNRQDWDRVHHALKDAGVHPGRTDDHLATVIGWLAAERDTLRARVAELEANGVHSCHPECPRPLCVAQRRIAELEAARTPSWWRCDTHGPAKAGAWGCPECVRELRDEQARAIAEAVAVALDPRVSSDAQALIDRGAAQASTGARAVPMLTEDALLDCCEALDDPDILTDAEVIDFGRAVEARVRELCGIGQAGAEGGV